MSHITKTSVAREQYKFKFTAPEILSVEQQRYSKHKGLKRPQTYMTLQRGFDSEGGCCGHHAAMQSQEKPFLALGTSKEQPPGSRCRPKTVRVTQVSHLSTGCVGMRSSIVLDGMTDGR